MTNIFYITILTLFLTFYGDKEISEHHTLDLNVDLLNIKLVTDSSFNFYSELTIQNNDTIEYIFFYHLKEGSYQVKGNEISFTNNRPLKFTANDTFPSVNPFDFQCPCGYNGQSLGYHYVKIEPNHNLKIVVNDFYFSDIENRKNTFFSYTFSFFKKLDSARFIQEKMRSPDRNEYFEEGEKKGSIIQKKIVFRSIWY